MIPKNTLVIPDGTKNTLTGLLILLAAVVVIYIVTVILLKRKCNSLVIQAEELMNKEAEDEKK